MEDPMAGSHTPTSACHTSVDSSSLTVVSTAAQGLSERLAGRVDGHLAAFAEHMREGLLAASTAVGLEVMAELMETEVTELVGPKGKQDPDRAATRHRTGRRDVGRPAAGGAPPPCTHRHRRRRARPRGGSRVVCRVRVDRPARRGHRRADAGGDLHAPVHGRARTRRLGC
jgi:hypothetical protein